MRLCRPAFAMGQGGSVVQLDFVGFSVELTDCMAWTVRNSLAANSPMGARWPGPFVGDQVSRFNVNMLSLQLSLLLDYAMDHLPIEVCQR